MIEKKVRTDASEDESMSKSNDTDQNDDYSIEGINKSALFMTNEEQKFKKHRDIKEAFENDLEIEMSIKYLSDIVECSVLDQEMVQPLNKKDLQKLVMEENRHHSFKDLSDEDSALSQDYFHNNRRPAHLRMKYDELDFDYDKDENILSKKSGYNLSSLLGKNLINITENIGSDVKDISHLVFGNSDEVSKSKKPKLNKLMKADLSESVDGLLKKRSLLRKKKPIEHDLVDDDCDVLRVSKFLFEADMKEI